MTAPTQTLNGSSDDGKRRIPMRAPTPQEAAADWALHQRLARRQEDLARVRRMSENDAGELVMIAMDYSTPNPWVFLMTLPEEDLTHLLAEWVACDCMTPRDDGSGGTWYPGIPCDACKAGGVKRATRWHG